MRLEILTRQDHAGLRIDPLRALQSAAAVHLVPLVQSEIRRIAAEFPVFLAKDGQTGQFYPAALLGLAPGENLFWDGQRLDADAVPLNLLRLPFFIAGDDAARSVCIDADSPALAGEGGQAIVDAAGQDTPYMRSIQAILHQLVADQAPTRGLVDRLVAARCVMPAQLDLTFADGSTARLDGLYTVDERAIERGGGGLTEALGGMSGLVAALAIALSGDRVRLLVRRRNARLAAEAQWFESDAG